MSREDITRADVLQAIAEFDQVGQEVFPKKYQLGKATSYLIHYGGGTYDSRAILTAAHGFHPGLPPLTFGQSPGSENDSAKYLRRLGFVVPPRR